MTRTHYLLLITIAALAMLTGCTTASRDRLSAVGKILLPIAQKVAVDEFNEWLDAQTL